MSQFGLTYLSRAAVREAQRLMLGGRAGVRDEIGFLIVHQRYADRLFPGTSVLHTRLRYVLFLPWIHAEVRAAKGRTDRARDAISKAELNVTKRLLNAQSGGHGVSPAASLIKAERENGIIGGQVYDRPSSQPPSYVYWTALTAWGLLRRRADLRPYSRAEVERLLDAALPRRMTDDDGQPLATSDWPFACELEPPEDWLSDSPLSFALTSVEKQFLAKQLRSVRSPAAPAEPSLLARLVGRDLADIPNCWDSAVLGLAGTTERPVLERAGRAAALAALGRGAYAAMVETLRFRERPQTTDVHRAALSEVMATWSSQARDLDYGLFLQDVGALPVQVEMALRATYEWAVSRRGDPMVLLPTYRAAERIRKERRARLADTVDGASRRLEWHNEMHGAAEPLHYRWNNVKRLLADLEGVR